MNELPRSHSHCVTSLVILANLLAPLSAAPQGVDQLPERAARLFDQAKTGKFYATAEKLSPEIVPMQQAAGFLVVWRAGNSAKPARWIVSLPGRHGFATDDLAIWSPHLKGRDIGLVSVQWWLGSGDGIESYLRPEQIYREIDRALPSLGAQPGAVLFHGFSRGSANSYAIAALDAGRGHRYFSLHVASSGGVALDYPPTHAILEGRYGPRPLAGTCWITSAGARDPEPERDGIPGMQRTAAWLKEQGAEVRFAIEDPKFGHGALVLNKANARRLLDEFERLKAP